MSLVVVIYLAWLGGFLVSPVIVDYFSCTAESDFSNSYSTYEGCNRRQLIVVSFLPFVIGSSNSNHIGFHGGESFKEWAKKVYLILEDQTLCMLTPAVTTKHLLLLYTMKTFHAETVNLFGRELINAKTSKE